MHVPSATELSRFSNLIIACRPTLRNLDGTSGGTRTHTLVKEADFESAASTNSATLAIAGKCPENAQETNAISDICKSYMRRSKRNDVH